MTASADSTPVLQVAGISKRFGKNQALSRVDFVVPEASLTVLLGPAGAGKTTILRTIAGLESPDEGHILLNGEAVDSWEPRHRQVAMIFDNLALYPDKTGYANIASPLVIKGESKGAIQERVETLAKTLHITHVLGRLPKTMSGGEKQRIALGRALIRSPRLFLLDEPLASLDAQLRVELRAELRRMQRDQGYTFLLATPDYHEALAVADTLIMLHQGRVVQVDQPQALYDAPADRETALFVGAPQINLFRSVYQSDSRQVVIEEAGAGFSPPASLVAALQGADRPFELGIRPENLALTPAGSGDFDGTLVDMEPLGPKSVATVEIAAAEFRVLMDSTAVPGLTVGQGVGLQLISRERLLAFDLESGRRVPA